MILKPIDENVDHIDLAWEATRELQLVFAGSLDFESEYDGIGRCAVHRDGIGIRQNSIEETD